MPLLNVQLAILAPDLKLLDHLATRSETQLELSVSLEAIRQSRSEADTGQHQILALNLKRLQFTAKARNVFITLV